MRKNALFPLTLLFLICSCKSPTDKEQISKSEYFDIKGYFEAEISRVSKLKPSIKKTVAVNGILETKTIKIKDWKHELSAFSDADINRASWKGLFIVSKMDTMETYLSENDKVTVREVTVKLRKGQVYKISIVIQNKNMLYDSVDSLIYVADSLYRVKKQQNIKFLSTKNYLIEGKFK
ncbi:hypothetical protein [Pedobacter sp. JCM 36344]|uniref:hypothetical protein n=1 Tax=Pedobacter sp. JCM 36344 TaxID=3374280 RepID=UPI00397D95A4